MYGFDPDDVRLRLSMQTEKYDADELVTRVRVKLEKVKDAALDAKDDPALSPHERRMAERRYREVKADIDSIRYQWRDERLRELDSKWQ
ncbi:MULTISPECIES: hypothetical protein [Bifidobacterium]|jgi:hypothetical protein|nr:MULTISPECIES: hypothetical protein [Bifidobacterium]KAE8128703.1 hypothetical protein DDE84_04370 [Bifidobacterium tibiigranuli]KAE8128894.1 hypothetical protein DDF78_04160 [Bifidobacterium tibiigranuli]MCH3973495.1 hypothetical protein [Bifidobacterium tibiigranuli]MCH4190629.1 hypothetical protein [Bifidobacterium tibiigranuli]QOL36468.1 hypothetical protein BS3272_00135 [Bifidobacterium subtile]